MGKLKSFLGALTGKLIGTKAGASVGAGIMTAASSLGEAHKDAVRDALSQLRLTSTEWQDLLRSFQTDARCAAKDLTHYVMWTTVFTMVLLTAVPILCTYAIIEAIVDRRNVIKEVLYYAYSQTSGYGLYLLAAVAGIIVLAMLLSRRNKKIVVPPPPPPPRSKCIVS